jgi:glycerol-1-phosphate dehydrogenase [NAD(P)+]
MARVKDMGAFNKYKAMEFPRCVVVGHDALEDVAKVCARLRVGSPAFLIEDAVTREVAGKRVRELLEAAQFEVQETEITEANYVEIGRTQRLLAETKAAVAFGIGGGRPIDVAKCASFNVGIPFVSIPTAASHDGIVSSKASILGAEGKKESVNAHCPMAVIGDTKIIASAPHRLLVAGCADVISNATAVLDWDLAAKLRNEYYSTSAVSLSRMTAEMMIENAHMIRPGLEDSAWFVMKALVSSGMAMSIAGSSRPASGSEHMFSHALDMIAKKPALHGEQVGVGTIMMMYLHRGDWRGIRGALKTLGAPTSAAELEVAPEEVIEALMRAHEVRPERYTILGEHGLGQEAAMNLATVTKVI